jgi:hypothetical protein
MSKRVFGEGWTIHPKPKDMYFKKKNEKVGKIWIT